MMPEPNDPTRAGAPVPEGMGARVRLSMTELETLAAKAARGAGLAWGLAEEAGAATRWLQARGFDGADLLLAHLERNAGACWQDVAPVIKGRTWKSSGGHPLCPIATGTTLCDHAPLAEGLAAGPILLTQVDCPALLLPFLSGISHRMCKPCALDWAESQLIVSGDVIHSRSLLGQDMLSTCADVQVSLPSAAPEAVTPAPAVRKIAIATLRGLDALAMRTTVPASEQSRQGAGAGTTDND